MSDQGGRKNRLLRLLPLVVALLALSLALGSLPKSQPGGSWLLNSYWILYVIVLLPVIALGVLVVGVIVLAYYWKAASEALGEGMAQRRMGRRRGTSKRARVAIFIFMCILAIVTIYLKCHGPVCTSTPRPIVEQIVNDTSGPPSSVSSSLGGISGLVANLVSSDWYSAALLGLLVIGGAIMVRAFKVSMDESRKYGSMGDHADSLVATEGLVAVQDAIRIIEELDSAGPRERIVACYERMIKAASDLGANVTPDLTARELENSIRNTFLLRGQGIGTLTNLFEEARYSLHSIAESDSEVAHSCLLSIEDELHLHT